MSFISCKEEKVDEPVDFILLKEEIHTGIESSIRGISIAPDNSVWISGSGGLVLQMNNDQELNISPKGYEALDFRSVKAFDSNNAVIMSAGSPAIILKTEDGGVNWQQVYSDSSESAFFNVMDFWNTQEGIAFGDPINGKFSILKTYDGGSSWLKVESMNCPNAFQGEAGFAASGTNMKAVDDSHLYYLTGGAKSRMLFSADKGENWLSFDLPIRQGKESEGGYSFDINTKGEMTVLGGDWTETDEGLNSSCYSLDKGMTWSKPNSEPSGYKSCVQYLNDSTLIGVGVNGIDISEDAGLNWNVSDTTHKLNVVKFMNDSIGYAAGNGVILKLTYARSK